MTRRPAGTHYPRVLPMKGEGSFTVIDEKVIVKRGLRSLGKEVEQRAMDYQAAIDAATEAVRIEAEAASGESRHVKERKPYTSRARVEREYGIEFPKGATKKDAENWAKAKRYPRSVVREIHKARAERPRGRPRKANP